MAQPAVGRALEEARHLVDVAVGDEEIRVREEDELARRGRDALVDRPREPRSVPELEQPHARILESVRDGLQPVRLSRVVVQQEDLELALRPVQEPRQRALDEMGVRVAGHEDANALHTPSGRTS